MPYDRDLAERVRAVLPPAGVVTERQMFGGLAFMLGGHMCCGIVGDSLMVRLDAAAAERALTEPHVRPMDPAGLGDPALDHWVEAAVGYVSTLPPKPAR